MQTAVSLLFAAPYPNARLQQQLDVLRQHPPALVPVLQRQCQIVRWSSPTSSDEQQRNELRDLIQVLTIGPTQVGAWFELGDIQDPTIRDEVFRRRAALLRCLLEHDASDRVDELVERLVATLTSPSLPTWKREVQQKTLDVLLQQSQNSRWRKPSSLGNKETDGSIPRPSFWVQRLEAHLSAHTHSLRAFLSPLLLRIADLSKNASSCRKCSGAPFSRSNAVPAPSLSLLPPSYVSLPSRSSEIPNEDIDDMKGSLAVPSSPPKEEAEEAASFGELPDYDFPFENTESPLGQRRPSPEEIAQTYSDVFGYGSFVPLTYDPVPTQPSLLAPIDPESPSPRVETGGIPREEQAVRRTQVTLVDLQRPPSPSPDQVPAKKRRKREREEEEEDEDEEDKEFSSPQPHATDPSEPVPTFKNCLPWTEEEERQLIDGKKAGKPRKEIAASLGKSVAACDKHWHVIKDRKEFIQTQLRWTDEMKASLAAKVLAHKQKEGQNKNIPWAHISEEMRTEFNNSLITKDACQYCWKVYLKPGLDNRPITTEEKEAISKLLLHNSNLTIAEIRENIPALAKRNPMSLSHAFSHVKKKVKR